MYVSIEICSDIARFLCNSMVLVFVPSIHQIDMRIVTLVAATDIRLDYSREAKT